MNYKNQARGRKPPLKDGEKVSQFDQDFLDELNKEDTCFIETNRGHYINSSGLKVKHLGNLKTLKKEPLENYFEGTKPEKNAKRKVRNRSQRLNEFVQNESHLNETGSVPSVKKQFRKKEEFLTYENVSSFGAQSTKKEESLTEKEKNQRKTIQYKIYKNVQKRADIERKTYIQQRSAEKNYIHQQEHLADTWMKYLRNNNKFKNFNINNEPPIISQKVEKADKGPSKKEREKEENCDENQWSFDALGGEFYEKLVFAKEDSDEER